MQFPFFREQKHYSLSQVSSLLETSEEKCKEAIGVLKKYGIVKSVDKSKPEFEDLSDLDVIISDVQDSSDCFKFCFVGVVVLGDFVFFCYPKYIDNAPQKSAYEKSDEKSKSEFLGEFKTIIKVIQKYSQEEQSISLYNGTGAQKTFNRLAISLYILRDYFENGLYTNQKENITQNGEGEILWNKTIDETFAFLKNGAPYYLEPFTKETSDDDFDFVRRLHAAVVTECSKFLSRAKILELFDLNEANLTSENLSDFGETDYIKYRLEKTLGEEFVTKKRLLLKTLYTYISEEKSDESENSLSFFGTNAFNLVWEKACADVFESVRDVTFRELKRKGIIEINENNKEYLKDSESLKNLIEKVKWTFNDKALLAAETLEPDIITILGKNFFILDAKYYLIEIGEDGISHQPGIQDVVKQFAYYKAFLDFVNKFGFKNVVNAFLVPKKSSDKSLQKFRIVGKAELDLMQFYSLNGKLPPIQIVEFSPDFVYENYLFGAKIPEKLKLLVESSTNVYEKMRNYEINGLQVAESPLDKAAQISSKINSDATYNTTHKF